MTDTTFIDRDFNTPIVADWLNDTNKVVYRALGVGGVAPITAAEVRTNLGYATSGGAALVGFTRTETGAAATLVSTKLQEMASVKDFGATGDGVTDDTAAINAATLAMVTLGKALFFPAGTYLATELIARTGMKWVGESSLHTEVKLKTGTNPAGTSALVYSPTTSVDDVWIQGMRFNGNSGGNTSGNTLVIRGARPTLIDVVVYNSAENGITTDWAGPSFRVAGSEGHFSHIVIDSSQKSGWLHAGPSDSHFDDIIIIDAGLQTNNSFYGMYLDPIGTGSNGRFNNLHHWNRSSTTNVAAIGVYVGFGGSTFTNCHFEGGQTCLSVPASFTTFAACEYYAPRGTYAVVMLGAVNNLTGVAGATYFSSNPNYTGLYLGGASNTIDLTVGGAITGIHFADGGSGGNSVSLTGYLDSPGTAYTGIYAANDTLIIQVLGGGAGTLLQTSVAMGGALTTYTSSIASETGTLTAATITGAAYSRVGNLIYYDIVYNIATVGTGGGFLMLGLPTAATSLIAGGAIGSNTSGTIEGHFISAGASRIAVAAHGLATACVTGNGHVAGWYYSA